MSKLEEIRRKYPEYDELSDYDLATGVYDKFYADQIDRDEFFQRLGVNPAFEEISTTDYALGLVPELGKGVARGFGKGLLGAGAGLAAVADSATNKLGFDDLIDSGEDNELIRLANEGKRAIDDSIGIGDAYRDSYAVKVSEALGSLSSFALPGLGAAGLAGRLGAGVAGRGVAGTAAVTATGAGFGGDDQQQRIAASRARGIEVDQDTADNAILLGAGVGTLEAIAPLAVLKKIRGIKEPRQKYEELEKIKQQAKEAGDEIAATQALNQQLRLQKEMSRVLTGTERVTSALKTGVIEATQEAVNSLLQDMIQAGFYDDTIEVGDSLWDDLTVGFGAGALFDGVSVGVANRRNKAMRQALEEKELQIREQEEQQRDRYYEEADRARREAEIDARLGKEFEYEQEREAGQRPTREEQIEAIGESVRKGKPFVSTQRLDDITLRYGESTDTEYNKRVGKAYASQIARDASQKDGVFPDAGTFDVVSEEVVEGIINPRTEKYEEVPLVQYKVVHTVTGQEYGTPAREYESAAHFASNLNQELINRNVTNAVIDALDLSPDIYTPEQSASLFMTGQKLVRPENRSITAEVLNEAGKTTTGFGSQYVEGMSIDSIHQQQYGVPPLTDRGEKLYKPLSNLTVAQQINFERRKKGLPEKDEFSLVEAKEALGDNYPRVFDVMAGIKETSPTDQITDFGTVGAEIARSRAEYKDDISTKAAIKNVLESKNIITDVDSPAMKYAFEQIVNESEVSNMSPSQRLVLVSELSRLPVVQGDAPVSMPDFRPKPYTRKLYNQTLDHVRSTADGSIENIRDFISERIDERRLDITARGLRKALLDSGLINPDGTTKELEALPSPEPAPVFTTEPYTEEDPSDQARQLEYNLQQRLTGLGLDDIKLRVLDVLKFGPVTRDQQLILTGEPKETERIAQALGYYNRGPKTTFLAIDRANQIARDETPEAREAALTEILDHEIVHALREMDLWTDAEWSLLEKAAKNKIFPGTGNETFFNNAQKRYRDLTPVGQMEEAVAELIRYMRKDRALVTGKPRAMVNRMYQFIERTGNALRGTGFQSFEDIVNRLESGEIGARERGRVRTLRSTERLLGAVPERGVGRAIDEDLDKAAPVEGEPPKTAEELIEEAPSFARRPSTTPIESLVERAKTKYADYNSAVEEEFFGTFWPKVMAEIKGTTDPANVRTAAKRAIRDVQTFVSQNPKYADYYAEDMRAIKAALEREYGSISEDDMLYYQVANGLTSPATVLSANVGDALNVLDLYIKKGNLDDIELGLSPKGNRVVASSPFQISGTTAPTKAMSLKVFDSLVKQFSNEPNPVQAAVDYLREGVPVKELHEFNRAMGYKGNVGTMGAIKSLVKEATGQDELIPRMFIFGKKIGSYTLNLTGDSRYTTIDVWESRFIRSYFEGLFEKNTGVPITVDEDTLFQDFSKIFKEEYDKVSGKANDPASLQAMRWFYMINAAKQAGYQGASTNETISEITERKLQDARERRDAGRQPSDATPNTQILAARIEESQRAADRFSERNQEGSIRHAADQDPELQRAVVQQEILDGATPLSIQSNSHSLGNRFIYQIQDKLVGYKNVEKQVEDYRKSLGLRALPEEFSPYRGEESIPGKIGFASREFVENRKKPLANKIAKLKLDLDEIDEFLTLRHAIERNKTISLRDPQRDPEKNPGSGTLKSGDPLTDSFVKQRMKTRYDLDWNDETGTWSGGNSRAKKFLDIASDVDQIVRETMNTTVAGGLISKENADVIMDSYKYYAPLRGKDIEDDYAESIIVNAGLSTKGKETLRAMGRESAAQSPLGHILLNAERAIARSIKNKEFGQRLVNLIKAAPDDAFWRVISPEDPRMSRGFEKKFTYVGKDPELQGRKFSEIPEGMDRKDFLQLITVKKDFLSPMIDKDLIGVKVGGQQVYVELNDPRMRDAVVSMDIGTVDKLLQKFGIVNRWLSMVNTSLNPEFVIGNFTKDVQTAIFNILGEQDMSSGKAKDQALVNKVLKDVIPSMGVFYKGLRRYDEKTGRLTDFITGISSKDKADFVEYVQAGAKADWFHSRPPEDQVKSIKSMIDMANGTLAGTTQKRFQEVLRFVEDVNDAVENAVRFATFKASRDELLNAGVPRDQAVKRAASLAKNLTINFNRKGMAGDFLNSLYLFFNASVQGTANFARGLFGPKGNPFSSEASRIKQGAVGGLIALGALTAMKAEEESEENPRTGRSYYSEIPAYVKERNMIIMADPTVPPEEGARNTYLDKDGKEYKDEKQYYYTIPLPYGYNTFHVFGQVAHDVLNGTMSQSDGAASVTSSFLGSFSPVGFGPNSLFPTIMQPGLEIGSNENFFGSPIFRENIGFGTDLPDSQMHMNNTRAPFKFVAETLNTLSDGNPREPGFIDISPDTLEHYTEFLFGGAGTFGLRNLDAFDKWRKGEELELREIPFLRRIKGEPTEQESVSDYYERRQRVRQKLDRLDDLRGSERIAYRAENRDFLAMDKALERAEKKIRDLRRERSSARQLAAKSPQAALRAARIEQKMYDDIQLQYDKFNKLYDERVGRTK